MGEPTQLIAGDFNEDAASIRSCLIIKGQSYPLASRDELLDEIGSLRKKFIKYEDYANASMQDVATKEQLSRSYKFFAYKLESCWLENLSGKDFRLRDLPLTAQFCSVHGFLHEELDQNGKKEVILAGNFYPFKPAAWKER